MATLRSEIRGTDLPGRSCGPGLQGEPYDNVHVGLKTRKGIIELVPGDAPSASWTFDITVRPMDDGGFDFGGPFVLGNRDDRHLGLCWVTVAEDGSTNLFRGAKLKFAHVDPGIVERAVGAGGRLVAVVGMTDARGHPVCATVGPPGVVWSVEAP